MLHYIWTLKATGRYFFVSALTILPWLGEHVTAAVSMSSASEEVAKSNFNFHWKFFPIMITSRFYWNITTNAFRINIQWQQCQWRLADSELGIFFATATDESDSDFFLLRTTSVLDITVLPFFSLDADNLPYTFIHFIGTDKWEKEETTDWMTAPIFSVSCPYIWFLSKIKKPSFYALEGMR